MNVIEVLIPVKLPGLNDYIRANRANRYEGAMMKRDTEAVVSLYIRRLPVFQEPIRIHFHWIEGNKRRDYDNIAFAKKFILDALVKQGKLKDDNRRFVTGFTDSFEVGKEWAVRLTIEPSERGCDDD